MANLEVSYLKTGDKHEIITGNAAIPNIIVDNTGIAPEDRAGTAKHLLASSALFCYAAAVATAMDGRAISYSNLRGKASVLVGNNANAQARVLEININMEVDMAEQDREAFEKIQKIMKNGCLVTNSLYDGIDMNYKLGAQFK